MKTFYRITSKIIVETNCGNFKMWVEKLFCENLYMFFAKQISIKAFGEHYFVESEFLSLRMISIKSYSLSINVPITTYETRLQYYGGNYIGKITRYKRQFELFKHEITCKARNEIIKVS